MKENDKVGNIILKISTFSTFIIISVFLAIFLCLIYSLLKLVVVIIIIIGTHSFLLICELGFN